MSSADVQRYYDEKFPFEFVLKFISNGGKWNVKNREIMLSIPLMGNENSMRLRYNSVANEREWRSLLIEHSKFAQIDVGAVYFEIPRSISDLRSHISPADAVEFRELVFDVDLSEYADVRYCCGSSKKCCRKCWPLAVTAAVFLEKILRQWFGCKKLVWLFSGRRGVHCWVYEEKYAKITAHYRESVVFYINQICDAIRGGCPVPRCIEAALSNTCLVYKRFFDDQRLFADIDRFEKLIEGLDVPMYMIESFKKGEFKDFSVFTGIVNRHGGTDEEKRIKASRKNVVTDIVLKAIFPRLDKGVTNDPAHLIKMPFSLHPSTGAICMPMTLEQIRSFDPESNDLHMNKCTAETIQRGMKAIDSMLNVK